ncbi:hypothetical protein ACHAWT_010238 [Skeletonema menzelii]
MYSSSLPPQEGNDPKLSSIMLSAQPSGAAPSAAVASAAVASAGLQQQPPIVSKPAIMTMKHPPQVGNDPKLLACMNDGDDAVVTSLSPLAGLSAADSALSHHQQQQQLSDAAPPSKESIANSLLSFKQTSPITTASPGTRPFKQNPVDSSTSSNHNVTCASVEAAAEPCINNSNFWLQEEEERFLLGLRMFGWGQWKRIQPIVKTRTNTQIKSHAQKREKVNPEIKAKYSKGVCRRGRISSGVLANDARVLSTNGGDLLTTIAHDQHQFPPLEQMARDVYQTNNGDGPNSRVRRYRHTPYHRSTYRPHSTQVVPSSPSILEESVTATATASLPQDQLCKEASYFPGMEYPGTVNSCLTRDGGHRYHILFDNEEEGRDLREKNVLHRLDYDKLFNHK